MQNLTKWGCLPAPGGGGQQTEHKHHNHTAKLSFGEVTQFFLFA